MASSGGSPVTQGRETLFYCPTCSTTDHGVADVCAFAGLCRWCKERPATLHFGDLLSYTHGAIENCCELCCAEMQLQHAREQAALIPEREAVVERLMAELPVLSSSPRTAE